jgi:pimeloyl-ACP methyl ester carboxylesterase
VTERQEQVADMQVLWREAPATGPAPVVYLHGVPTSGGDWLPFLERTGGYALDLPGFGRSDKPTHFDYSIDGYGKFLSAWVDQLGLDRYTLVMHDWGAVGLALAQEQPERVERLVIVNTIPLAPGFTWHRWARIWRTPLVGELAMGFTLKRVFRAAMRPAFAGTPPDEFVDDAYAHFDHGTQRAILKLYRSAPPEVLAAAGERLGEITAPALVVHGEEDRYLQIEFAQAQADRLGGDARVELIPGAGHWPWIDKPEVVDLVTGFVT